MSQVLSSSIQLTKEQIQTTINNLAKIRHFEKIEVIFEGKPSYSDSSLQKLKQLGIEPLKITKFADNYIIYKFSQVKPNKSVEELQMYNKGIKIKNLDERVEFAIVVESNKFDKQNYLAIQALYPLIYEDIKDKSGCYVSICPSNLITSAISKHFVDTILPCNYRMFSLCSVYPLIGSKSSMFCGFIKDYELCEYKDLYNGAKYQTVYDNEPIVKILNAMNGDLIVVKALRNEKRPYWEYSIAQVKQCLNDADSIDISGLVYEESTTN